MKNEDGVKYCISDTQRNNADRDGRICVVGAVHVRSLDATYRVTECASRLGRCTYALCAENWLRQFVQLFITLVHTHEDTLHFDPR